MKALAIADIHIGNGVKYGVLPGDRLEDQRVALETVVNEAIHRQADVLIVAGDIFDGPTVLPEHYAAFQAPMRRLKAAGIPCVAVLGNGRHDLALRDVTAPAVVSDVCEFYAEPAIRQVGDTYLALLPWCPVNRLVAEHDGGDRAAIHEAAAEMLIEVARGLRASPLIPAGAPCVLVTHFAIQGASLPTGLMVEQHLKEVILPLADLEALGYDAVIAGHIHLRQFLSSPGSSFGQPILYPGSLLPVDFSEADGEHGATLITIRDDLGAETEFIPIESRPFITLGGDLTHEDSTGNIFHHFDLETIDLTDAIVKVRYTATAEQASRISHEEIERAILDAGAVKVFAFDRTVIRDTRARVEGIDEQVGTMDALRAWMVANDLDLAQTEALDTLTLRYLERLAQAAETVAGGLRPIRVRATNYRTYSELDFTFPDGFVAFVGENGSGKSSTINLVDVCLFAGRGELGDLIRTGEDAMSMTLDFESAGEMYRVRRSFRRNGSQKVDLERWEDAA